MSRRTRTLVQRSLAVAFGVALATVGLEGIYRLIRTRGLGPTTNPAYVTHDERLGWRYLPQTRDRHRTREFDVEIAINAQGFRGPDWMPHDGRRRILLLGDSFAFGWGVDEDEAIGARLERLMPEWQVRKAAVSGYATDQELLLLEELLPEAAPDAVVVVYCSNDRMECTSSAPYGLPKPYFERRDGRIELAGVPIRQPWLLRRSHLARAIAKSIAERSRAHRALDPNGEWALVCDLYRAMRDRLNGVPLLIVSSEERLARLAAEEEGIRHVDVRAVVGAAGDAMVFPIDRHWTAPAHALVAEELARSLRALLP